MYCFLLVFRLNCAWDHFSNKRSNLVISGIHKTTLTSITFDVKLNHEDSVDALDGLPQPWRNIAGCAAGFQQLTDDPVPGVSPH